MGKATGSAEGSKPKIGFVHSEVRSEASGAIVLDNVNISVEKNLTVTALSTAESMFMTLASDLRSKRNEVAAIYWEKEAGILAELKRQILTFSRS